MTLSSMSNNMHGNIFISWSGNYSHQAAFILREYIPNFLDNGVLPWATSEDNAKGTQWNRELTEALRQPFFCIIMYN